MPKDEAQMLEETLQEYNWNELIDGQKMWGNFISSCRLLLTRLFKQPLVVLYLSGHPECEFLQWIMDDVLTWVFIHEQYPINCFIT